MRLGEGAISNLVEVTYETGMTSSSLIGFFNSFGLNHEVVHMLASKRQFADQAWRELNGRPEIAAAVSEILHPHFWSHREEERQHHIESLNRSLRYDGFEIVPAGDRLTIRPVTHAAGTAMLETLKHYGAKLDHQNLVSRIHTIESDLETQPGNAIGAAKEMIEAVAKEIIVQSGQEYGPKANPSALVKQALKCLNIAPKDIPEQKRGTDAIRSTLTSLSNIVHQLDELRALYGSGHGRDSTKGKGLEPRHARMAVGAAGTLCLFLVETFEKRGTQS